MQNKREMYMQRCFDLAKLGKMATSPNPNVGAVLVLNGEIIGEGYHKKYGSAHAEVNAIAAVAESQRTEISNSELFVSLEPCNFVGNTPACTSLIIHEKIKKVSLSVIDETNGVNHTGIDKLRSNNIKVETGILKRAGSQIARQRNTFVSKRRPYIILKWAESADGFMGQHDKQVWLTNDYSKRLVHKWRAETDAIMVGTNTVVVDDPNLTTRLFPGPSPLRVVIDKKLSICRKAKIYNNEADTWIFASIKRDKLNNISYHKIDNDSDYISSILSKLYEANKSSLLIEGGRRLLNSFIAAGYWDEIRCFKTKDYLRNGVRAPLLYIRPHKSYQLKEDTLKIYFNTQN